MKKKITVMFSVLLVLVLLVSTLVACKKEDDEKKKPTPPTANDIAEGYAGEMKDLLVNSIGADIANGFNMDLTGEVGFDFKSADKDKYDWNYSYDIAGNVLSKAGVNSDFRIVIKDGANVKFGLWNKGGDLFIQASDKQYKYDDTSIMVLLNTLIAKHVPNFAGLTTLPEINIGGGTIGEILQLLDMGLQMLCADPNVEDLDANLMISKVDNTYTAKIQVDVLKSILGLALKDMDLSFIPSGLVVDLVMVANDDKTIKKLDVKADVTGTEEGKLNFELNTSNRGLFGAVNADFKVNVPDALLAVESKHKLINFNIDSTVKFMDSEKKVVRDMVSSIDVDINPTVLSQGYTKETFMKLGYFSMTVKVNDGPYLIGLSFNPEATGDDCVNVFLMLAQDNNDISNPKKSMVYAGQFSISTLIASLTNDVDYTNPVKPTPVSATVEEGGINSTIKTILDMILPLLGIDADITPLINCIDIKNGISTIDCKTLFVELDKLIGNDIFSKPIIGNLSVPDLLFGKGVQYIELDTTKSEYGTAENVVSDPNTFVAEAFKKEVNLSNGFIKTSTIKVDETQFDNKFEYGTDIIDVYSSVPVSYTNTSGTLVENDNLMVGGIIGYDPLKVGKQNITIQALLPSQIGLLTNLIGGVIGGDKPLNLMQYISFIPINMEIEVYEKSAVTIETKGATTMKVGDNLFDTIATKLSVGDRKYPIEDNRHFINTDLSDIIDGNNLAKKAGVYTLEFNISGEICTMAITVVDVKNENIILGSNLAETLKPTMFTDVETALTADDIATIMIDGKDVKSDLITAEGIITELTQYIGKTATINYSVVVNDIALTIAIDALVVLSGKNVTVMYTLASFYDDLTVNSTLDFVICIDLYDNGVKLEEFMRIKMDAIVNHNMDYTYFVNNENVTESNIVITILDTNGADVTAEVLNDNGTFKTAGTYDIKVSGTFMYKGELVTIKNNNTDGYILNGGATVIPEQSKFLTNNFGDFYMANYSQGQKVDFEYSPVTITDYKFGSYPLGFDTYWGTWNWDAAAKNYYLSSRDAVDAVANKIPEAFRADIMNSFGHLNLDIKYSTDNGSNWSNFFDANGCIIPAGKMIIKVTVVLEGVEYSSTCAEFTVKGKTVNTAEGADNNLYVNEKLPEISVVYYDNNVKKTDVIILDAITLTGNNAANFNKEGYAKFTATGDYALDVTHKGTVLNVSFTVIDPTVSVPVHNGVIKVDNHMNSAQTDIVVSKGQTIYDMLATSGAYQNISVDANGAVVGGALTAAEIKAITTIQIIFDNPVTAPVAEFDADYTLTSDLSLSKYRSGLTVITTINGATVNIIIEWNAPSM